MVIQKHSQDSRGKKSETECWAYISHSFRAMFDHLHEIRRKAELHPKDPPSMVWQFLKHREKYGLD